MVRNNKDTQVNKEAPILGEFSGKCCDSNVFNNNDMHLSREVFSKLIASEEFKRAMANHHYIGYLGHPEDADCQEYEHACIVMKKLEIKDNGEIFGVFDLLNTPVGRVVKTFIDAGVNFGISIRGVGEVGSDGEVDPDQFIFRGFDLVTFPAYDDCIPEFREIAASTDTAKKAKYNKICASVNANLKDIKSCEALKLIQDQFPNGCDEYTKIQDRINELSSCGEADVIEAVNAQKLEAVTQLYLEAIAKVHELECALADCQSIQDNLSVECTSMKHKQVRLNKIVANQVECANNMVRNSQQQLEKAKATLQEVKASSAEQIKSIKANYISVKQDLVETQNKLAESEQSYRRQVNANSRLKERLVSLTKSAEADKKAIENSENINLKYKRKIEANSNAISQKDIEIEDLKKKLNETVVASKQLETEASNLDDKNEELLSRVEAAEEMVSSYQQAYANLYANALGVYLTGLPVTANTSVEELKQMIVAGTSTANIPANPSYLVNSSDYNEEDDEDEINADSESDEDPYLANMVTL